MRMLDFREPCSDDQPGGYPGNHGSYQGRLSASSQVDILGGEGGQGMWTVRSACMRPAWRPGRHHPFSTTEVDLH